MSSQFYVETDLDLKYTGFGLETKHLSFNVNSTLVITFYENNFAIYKTRVNINTE